MADLFPGLAQDEVKKAASYYTALNSTLPTPYDQAGAIMGECMCLQIHGSFSALANVGTNDSYLHLSDILPTPSFPTERLQGIKAFLLDISVILIAFKGEFAIPPGYHGDDIAYYFTS